MKKPKNKKKQLASHKRGLKRSKRFKSSRIKVFKNRQEIVQKRIEEKIKHIEFINKLTEARMSGGF